MSIDKYPVVLHNYISENSARSYSELLAPLCTPNQNREHIRGTLGYQNSKVASEIGISRYILLDYTAEEEPIVKEISELFLRIRKELEDSFQVSMDAVNFSYQEMLPGGSNPTHSDSTTLDGAPLRDDGMPEELEWSALLYLNNYDEDFKGGIIGFPKHDLVVKPMAGDLIFFPGNHHYPHYVEEVTEGIRKNFVLFFGRKGNTSDTVFFEKG